FVGPNIGSTAVGAAWSSPLSLFSPTGYASTTTGNTQDESTVGMAGVTGVNQGSGSTWINPANVWSILGAPPAFVSLSHNGSSEQLLASGTSFSLPVGANILGVAATYKAVNNDSAGAILSLQLANNGVAVGTPVSQVLSNFYTDRKSTRLNSSHRCISY